MTGLWHRVARGVEGSRRRLATLAVLSLFGGFAEAVLMFLIVQVAAAIAAGHDTIDLHAGPLGLHDESIRAVLLLAAADLVVLFALAFAASLVSARMTVAAVNHARDEMVAAFLDASWATQAREREGRLQELLSDHAQRVGVAVVLISTGISAGVTFLALLVSSFIVSAIAAVLILVGVVALYLVLQPVTRTTRRRGQRQATLNSEYALAVTELVGVAREVKVFDVAGPVEQALAARSAEAARFGVVNRVLARLTPSLYQYSALALILAGMAGAYAFSSGDVANLGAVVLLLVRALAYSQQVSVSIQQAVELAPYVAELDEQRHRYELDRVDRGGAPLGTVTRLRFHDVDYAYEPGQPVLRGVSFDIEAGTVIGIIGPSGGGKSTLVQLLLRLRHPDAGTYEVNGRPADSYALDAWHERFSFVPQDNRLLRGTVAENIAFHRPGLTRDEIVSAAQRAHLHDDIVRWPDGYDTVLGSGAMDISGGQRQRLGFARALVGQPSVLVLDEPTSALDLRSEALVQETLHELRGSLTLIIVAHRLSTLSACDRIMVLDHGSIQAFAEPAALHGANAFYDEVTRLAAPPA